MIKLETLLTNPWCEIFGNQSLFFSEISLWYTFSYLEYWTLGYMDSYTDLYSIVPCTSILKPSTQYPIENYKYSMNEISTLENFPLLQKEKLKVCSFDKPRVL